MMKRRTLLKVAAAGAVTAFSGAIPGLRALAGPALRIRRSVNSMALDDPDLETYREFVRLMRSKPPANRVSWVGFANQHGDADDFNYCPHGDWYFLPWHRGFVEMYEKAAAVLMQNPKFAMPYWDWTTLRDYPPAFSSPTYKGRPNPLFSPGEGDDFDPGGKIVRNPLGPTVLTNSLVGQKQVIDRIYAETVFERFGTSRNPSQHSLAATWVTEGGGVQGIMEATPHNQIHNQIGGFMPQSNSPRDPIFMMHHGNIDRIWAGWNNLGRKNSTNSLWLNMTFRNNYIAPDGTLYTRRVTDFLRTSALGYTYDNLPQPQPEMIRPDSVREGRMLALLGEKPASALKRAKAPSITAPEAGTAMNAPVHVEHKDLLGALEPVGGARPTEVVALISDIQVPANVGSIRVFVNRPSVSLDVPETDPHYVTTIAFLHHGGGKGTGHHKALPSTIVDLTEALRRLAQSKQLTDDNVTVQLLPVPMPGVAASAVGNITPKSIEIAFL
jgi:tyrosinase